MVTIQAGLVALTLMNWPTLWSTESGFGLAFMVGHATFLEAHAGGSGQVSWDGRRLGRPGPQPTTSPTTEANSGCRVEGLCVALKAI
jgi:hypothetical protein